MDTLPRMQDITRNVMSHSRRNSVQDCCCGRGKVVLKNCENDMFDCLKAALCLKERGFTSATSFLSLEIFCVRSGAAHRWCRQRQRKQRSFAATIDFAELSLFAHATAAVLSQKMPTWQKASAFSKYSRTSHERMMPASSRSLIVMVPVGVLKVTKAI